MKKILYLFLLMIFFFLNFSYAQGNISEDNFILSVLKREKAFLHWQTHWQNLLMTFDLDSFRIVNQREFSLRTLDSLSTVDLTKIDFPHMIAIAPNGQKVVAYGYAEMCQDDYCSVFLYDFQECKVFELFGVGLYLPSFNGFAWLNNELLLVVGIYFRFTREGEIETVAPSVTLYDFKLMNVRTLVGGFISREKYFKNRDNRVMIEPDLMLNLK